MLMHFYLQLNVWVFVSAWVSARVPVCVSGACNIHAEYRMSVDIKHIQNSNKSYAEHSPA